MMRQPQASESSSWRASCREIQDVWQFLLRFLWSREPARARLFIIVFICVVVSFLGHVSVTVRTVEPRTGFNSFSGLSVKAGRQGEAQGTLEYGRSVGKLQAAGVWKTQRR